jgi:hypothetical protein
MRLIPKASFFGSMNTEFDGAPATTRRARRLGRALQFVESIYNWRCLHSAIGSTDANANGTTRGSAAPPSAR